MAARIRGPFFSAEDVHVFCPNCGTQNPDTAVTCGKCGFNLKGAAAPKFKGTMMMVNQPDMTAPTGPRPAAGAPTGPAAPTPPLGQAPSQGPTPSKLKGTMVGVAPMMAGSAPAPFAGPPAPA